MSDALQPLNQQVLNDLKDAVGDSIVRIVNLYLEDTPKTLDEMQKALSQSELTTVGRLAHSLKSSSANLGAMMVANQAIELEQAINNGENDLAKISTAINAINSAFDQARPLFASYLNK